MNYFWLYLVVAAMLCGNWPSVMKFAHLNASWMSFVFALGTGIIAILGIALNPMLPPLKSIGIGTIAGAVNGLGLLALGILLARQEEVSKILPLFLGIMTVFSLIGGLLLLGEVFTFKKLIGTLVIAVGVYLLS